MSDEKEAASLDTLTCPECGSENPASAAACMACGGDLAAAAGPLGKIPAPVLVGAVLVVILVVVGFVAKSLYTKSRPGALTRSGMTALAAGDHGAAAKDFKEALGYDKKYVPAIVGLAKVGVATKDQELIKRYAKEAIDKSEGGPARAELRVAYAWSLLEGGDPREAVNQAIDAVEDDSSVKGVNAIRGLGALAIAPPQEDDAITFLSKAAAEKSERVDVYEHLAELLLKKKRYEEGRDAAQAAVKLSPEDPALWLTLGSHLEGCKDAKGYREALEKALALDGKNVLAHSRLSELYLEDKDLDKALKHAQEAANQDPENYEARLAVGRILLAYKRPHNARQELEKAKKLRDTWEVGYLLGRSEVETGAGSGGYRKMADALRKAPAAEAEKLWREAGELALAHDLSREARGDLEQQVKAHPNVYDLRLLLVRLYVSDSDPKRYAKEVRQHLDKALELDASRREAPVLLGTFLAKTGDVAGAIAAWDQALKNDPRDGEVLYLKGCAAIEGARAAEDKAKGSGRGLWEQAVEALKKLKEVDGSYKDVGRKLDEANNGLFYSKSGG
ncbi:MAG: tetratricopeptide repeat protein [Planctomycetota bacterium]